MYWIEMGWDEDLEEEVGGWLKKEIEKIEGKG